MSGILNVYGYDLSTQSLTPFPGTRNITGTVSPDHRMIAYMHRKDVEPAYQLYVANVDGSNPRQITTDAHKYKREPVWSHDGRTIAYSVQSENPNLSTLSPNTWGVYVTDLAGHSVLVGEGVDAFFSPDDTTLYVLQNDGVHAITLAKAKAAKTPADLTSTLATPLPIGKVASQTMKISVSPNGKYLAWSMPLLGMVRIFSITSWSPFTLAQSKELPTSAYYSVFSPDSSELALQEVTLDPSGVPHNARVIAYDLRTYSHTLLLDLSKYSVTYMWLTAWKQ